MAENKTKGTHLLTEKDFVDVVDDEGNDLAPVPKHWGADQLPAGAKVKRSSSGAKKTAKRSTAKKTSTAKKAASSSSGSGSTAASGDGSTPTGGDGS